MKYCTRCVMPDTRPGIYFDEEGVCQACRTEERKDAIDWKRRFLELEAICDRHRNIGRLGYNCIIPVSGGKDSHFQVHIMKEVLGMNPLLVTVEDNFPMTEAGKHNIKNISERFGCNILAIKPDIRAQKLLMRKTFEKYGKPTWYIDRMIYTFPLHIAARLGISLIVYGENVSYEYGGFQREETFSAKDQVENGVASSIPLDDLVGDGISESDLNFCEPPTQEDLSSLEPVYLSYFVRWNSYSNYLFAKRNGFVDLTHEWKRSNHIEDFDQVDSRAYLVHPWLKYPKFGHASATDYASKFIRYGLISRQEAIELVKKHDHELDPLALRDFCDFLGYSVTDFWRIVDRFYNREIFEKDKYGNWRLKNPIWETTL